MSRPRRSTLSVLLGLLTLPNAAFAQSPALDLAAAAAYSEAEAGLALLAYRDGELIAEHYHNGHSATKAQHIFSGTKSFAPILALIAQGEGLLTLDEPVADTITEWRGDARRERITVRHLLDFTSGLKNIDRQLHSGQSPDKYAASIACPAVREPGERFRYGSQHLMVFAALLQRKLEAHSTDDKPLPDDVLGYLEQRVLDPIGCRHTFWLRDSERQPILPYGAFLTAREWAKFGLLLLNEGAWGETQIIPKEHLAECFVGSEANPVYGLNFWLVGRQVQRQDPNIPADTVAAAGMYNQKLYVIPSEQLVIVRLGKTGAKSRFRDAALLGRLFAPRAVAPPSTRPPSSGREDRRAADEDAERNVPARGR